MPREADETPPAGRRQPTVQREINLADFDSYLRDIDDAVSSLLAAHRRLAEARTNCSASEMMTACGVLRAEASIVMSQANILGKRITSRHAIRNA